MRLLFGLLSIILSCVFGLYFALLFIAPTLGHTISSVEFATLLAICLYIYNIEQEKRQ